MKNKLECAIEIVPVSVTMTVNASVRVNGKETHTHDIPLETVSYDKFERMVNPEKIKSPRLAYITTKGNITKGSIVGHEKFGIGRVTNIYDGGHPLGFVAEIKFTTGGEKELILKFAKLELYDI